MTYNTRKRDLLRRKRDLMWPTNDLQYKEKRLTKKEKRPTTEGKKTSDTKESTCNCQHPGDSYIECVLYGTRSVLCSRWNVFSIVYIECVLYGTRSVLCSLWNVFSIVAYNWYRMCSLWSVFSITTTIASIQELPYAANFLVQILVNFSTIRSDRVSRGVGRIEG